MTEENYISIVTQTLSAEAFWSVNKALARHIGIEETAFLAEILFKHKYWKDRGGLDDQGGFFLKSEDIQSVMGIGVKPVARLTKSIQASGLVKVKKRGVPAKNYWYPQWKLIFAILTSEPQTGLTAEPQTGATGEAQTGVAITKNLTPRKKTKPEAKASSISGQMNTEEMDAELSKAILHIELKTGQQLRADKWLKIWFYNAVKLDGLNPLKFSIDNFCHNKANIEMQRWDWISFFKIQAKRANFLPHGTKEVSNGYVIPDQHGTLTPEELAAHRSLLAS